MLATGYERCRDGRRTGGSRDNAQAIVISSNMESRGWHIELRQHNSWCPIKSVWRRGRYRLRKYLGESVRQRQRGHWWSYLRGAREPGGAGESEGRGEWSKKKKQIYEIIIAIAYEKIQNTPISYWGYEIFLFLKKKKKKGDNVWIMGKLLWWCSGMGRLEKHCCWLLVQ